MAVRANYARMPSRLAHVPTYLPGRTPREAWAHFASGSVVRVVRGRSRAYPGLASEAPPTRPFYDAFCRTIRDVEHVVDFGCGAGEGTLRLSEEYDRVTGIDSDPEGLAFARELAPLALFLKHSMERPMSIAEANAGVAIDILGHVADPELVLANIRAALGADAALLVAEPAAFPAQTLVTPARRSFSKRELSSLLVRSGFHVRGWVCETSSFLSCVVEPHMGADTTHLVRAIALVREDRLAEAIAEFGLAAHSGNAEVRLEAILGEASARLTQGDGDGAARCLFRARELAPDQARPLVGLARLALAANDLGQALTLAVDAVEHEPTEPTAAQAVAIAAEAVEADEALDAWRAALRLSPADPAVAARTARLAADRGDFDVCTSVLERVRDYGEDGGPAFHVTMAWAYLAQGRRSDAMLEAQLAVRLAPHDPGVLELWSAVSTTDVTRG